MARILVAGGNGRLGRAVLAKLGTQGVAGVRGKGLVATIVIDSDGGVEPALLDGVDAIINCAGRVTGEPREIAQANIAYAINLARTARDANVARFVQVSSFSVYGRTEHIDHNSPIAPDSVYGHSKIAAEEGLAALAGDGFRPMALRLPFMFSADEPALFGRLIPLLRKLRVLPTPQKGTSRRSMITYAGAADALIRLALSHDVSAKIAVAADPNPLDLTTVARMIHMHLGKRIVLLPVPTTLADVLHRIAPGMIDRLLRSSELAPSANFLSGGTAHPVVLELAAYLNRVRRQDRR